MDELLAVFESLPKQKQIYAELMFYAFVASLEKYENIKVRKFNEGHRKIMYQVEVVTND